MWPCPPGSPAGMAPWARCTQGTPGSAAVSRSEPGQRASQGHAGLGYIPHHKCDLEDLGRGGSCGPQEPCWLKGPQPLVAQQAHVHALCVGLWCQEWPRRHRSRWGHPASGGRHTCGVPGVCLEGGLGGSAPQGLVRGSGASHLPSSPNTYRLAETHWWVGHQNPHRAHTACLPASSPPAPASGWALLSGPRTLGPAEKATHLAPPGGCAHFQVGKLSHQQNPGLRYLLAGVRATLQELEGWLGLPRRQSPALPTPRVLTMRWSPGPHMTTSSNSNCLATSCMLWPKGVI